MSHVIHVFSSNTKTMSFHLADNNVSHPTTVLILRYTTTKNSVVNLCLTSYQQI